MSKFKENFFGKTFSHLAASSKHIKKSNKLAITNIKEQKRLKLQKYRDKLLSDPKKNNNAMIDEDDERLIEFLRKYNEFKEKQNPHIYR